MNGLIALIILFCWCSEAFVNSAEPLARLLNIWRHFEMTMLRFRARSFKYNNTDIHTNIEWSKDDSTYGKGLDEQSCCLTVRGCALLSHSSAWPAVHSTNKQRVGAGGDPYPGCSITRGRLRPVFLCSNHEPKRYTKVSFRGL